MESEQLYKRRKILAPKLYDLLQEETSKNIAIRHRRETKASLTSKFGSDDVNKEELRGKKDNKTQWGDFIFGDESESDWNNENLDHAWTAGNKQTEDAECPECQLGINLAHWEKTDVLQVVDEKCYEDVSKEATVVKDILEAHSMKNGFVGMAIEPGVNLPPVMIGIMKAGCGFFPLEYKKSFSDSHTARKILQISWIITDREYYVASGLESVSMRIHLFQGDVFCLVKLKDELCTPKKIFPSFKYAYAMRTSGTTGNRRLVLVPHSAIVINVVDFIKVFKITEKDRILAIAPPTFDPSIIDLFASVGTGATIVFVVDSIKLVPSELAKVIVQEGITIMQCTPSFLKRFDLPILKSILGLGSSLRVLALGGEKCVSKTFLQQVLPEETSIRIFNVYGITEVSCWAAVEKINLKTDDPIFLGDPLSSINLDILGGNKDNMIQGELVIGFTKERACVVIAEKYGKVIKSFELNGDKNLRYFQTGDLVEICSHNNTRKLHYIDRLDRVRKRNGCKIDLEALETHSMEMNMFQDAWCVDWEQSIVLLLKLRDNNHDLSDISTQLYSHLKYRLSFDQFPDQIIFLHEDIPLSPNGKVDLKKILSQRFSNPREPKFLVEKSFKISSDQFQQIFNSLWNFSTRNVDTVSDYDFFLSSGGTSISAMILVEEFFNRIQQFGSKIHIENEKRLQCELLSKPFKEVRNTFFEVVENFVNYKCNFKSMQVNEKEDRSEDGEEDILIKNDQREIETETKLRLTTPPKWSMISVPIGLCVDATPVITEHPTEAQVCIIGSHSGALYAFSMSRLSSSFEKASEGPFQQSEDSLVWKKIFTGRIESAPAIHPRYYFAYLGCYDGKLYKISVIHGDIEWSFESGGGEIRSSPDLSPDGAAVVFHASNHIFCIDADSGTISWKRRCDHYILQTNHVAISCDAIFFVTVKGICAWRLLCNGQPLWESRHDNIRTSPSRIPTSQLVVFGDSTGNVIALNELDGAKVWKFNANQQIPNNITYRNSSEKILYGNSLIFSTHEGSLFILSAVTGKLMTLVDDFLLKSRSKPVIGSALNQNDQIKCCCFYTSLDGELFVVIFPSWNSEQSIVLEKKPDVTKIMKFSTDDAESFSSPVLSTNFGILAVGARDNCIHFVNLAH